MSTTTEPPRTRGVDRRTVVRSAAWTVPVIAVATAAPAFAASCQQLYDGTLDWGDSARYTPGAATSGGNGSVLHTDGTTTGLTLTTKFVNYTAASTNAAPTVVPNFGVTTNTVGGTPYQGLVLCQTCDNTSFVNKVANNQTITFTFTRNVYNVKFTLTDLDATTAQFWDAMAISTPTFGYSFPAGSTVIGVGAAADVANTTAAQTTGPFRPKDGTLAFANDTATGGNVEVTIPGPVKTFQMVYWNRQTAFTTQNGSKQTVYVSRLTAQTHNAGCNP